MLETLTARKSEIALVPFNGIGILEMWPLGADERRALG